MFNRSFILAPAAILTFTSLITLGGCSGSTDPTDTSGGSGGTGSGGTGSSAAPSSGGSGGGVAAAGSGNASNSGGSSAGSSSAKMQPLPTLSDCPDVVTPLNLSCAILGCHKGPYSSAGLDMTPDMGLVGRLKDVPANHTDITCANGAVCTTIPATCPTGDKIIDSSNVANSWILAKLNGTVNGCGTAMPPPPSYSISDSGKACVISLVNAIAALK